MATAEPTLSASLEDYLEAVFHIASEKGAARVKDIASRVGVNNSSVTQALGSLSRKGLVNYAPYDVVTLTDDGQETAADIVRRHRALCRFFKDVLALDPELAEDAACKMEHSIPSPVLERLIEFVEFVEHCPSHPRKPDWGAGRSSAEPSDSKEADSCTKA